MATVGVLLDRETCRKRWGLGLNVFETYITEILQHAGIAYTVIDSVARVAEFRVKLMLVAAAPEDKHTAGVLWQYAESGGILVSFGGINSLAGKLGYRRGKECLAGYAEFSDKPDLTESLRFLSAVPWAHAASASSANTAAGQVELTLESGTLHKDAPDGDVIGAACHQFKVGLGAIDRWAVNIPYTVACLQQGTKPVLEDGDPAPDGSSQVNEGILKTDDVMELDWHWDRGTSPGTPFPYFQIPYADLWRELFVEYLVHRALGAGLTLPFIGTWPDGVSQVALLSLDSDHNINDEAWTTLDLLRRHQVPATWCMMEPGYEGTVYERVKADGHELALHYNAVWSEGQQWGRESFRHQLNWLKEAIGASEIVSNKNHVTREEGWGDLFVWCEEEGVQTDQSRGPSKKGNGGFLFGTCHPYFPLSLANEDNRYYDVLQIGFLLSDFNHMGTDAHKAILRQVRRVGGVAHFVFHQTHLHTKEVDRKWLEDVVRDARALGFTFWTSRQINDWERTRRRLRIMQVEESGDIQVSGLPAKGTVVYVPTSLSTEAEPTEEEDLVTRYGVMCRKFVL